MVSIGQISLDTSISLRGFQQDRAKLMAAVDQLAIDAGGRFAVSIGKGLGNAKIGFTLRQEFSKGLTGIDVTIQRALARSVDGFGAALAKKISQEISGISLAPITAPVKPEVSSEDERKVKSQVARSFEGIGGTITRSILAANLASTIGSSILSGVQGVMGQITGLFSGMMSTVLGDLTAGIRQAIGEASLASQIGQATTAETQTINQQAGLQSIGKLSWSEAGASAKRTKADLAKVAAAQAGENKDYQQLLAGFQSQLIKGYTGKDGKLDQTELAALEKASVDIVKNVGNIAATSGRGNTSWDGAINSLVKLLNGASIQDLRSDDFFQKDAQQMLAYIDNSLKTLGAKSFGDLDKASQIQMIQDAAKIGQSPERAAASAQTMDSLVQAEKSKYFDATSGIFSIQRDIGGVEGNNVFASVKESVKTLGEFFTQLGATAQAAGLQLTDPMQLLKSAIDAVNGVIANATTNMQSFFGSVQGQALVESFNAAGQAMGVAFAEIGAALPSIITSVLEIATVLTTLAAEAIPWIAQGIVDISTHLAANPQIIGEIVSGLLSAAVAIWDFGLGVATALDNISKFVAPIVEFVANLVGATEISGSFANNLGQVVTYVAAISMGVGIIAQIMGVVTSIAGVILNAFGMLAGVVSAIAGIFSGPMILALVAIGTTIYTIIQYSKHWSDVVLGVRFTWQQIVEWLVTTFGWIGKLINSNNTLKGVAEGIKAVWQFYVGLLTQTFGWMGKLLGQFNPLKGIVDGIKGAWNGFVEGIVSATAKFVPFAEQVMGLWRMISGGGGNSGGGSGNVNSFFGVNNEADLYRLAAVAITEGKSGDIASQLDSAVSIGNRVQAGKWGGDASKVVSAPKQYEAWTRFNLQGVDNRASAIAALKARGITEAHLDAFLKALSDTSMVQKSIDHLKGSTDYRAFVPGVTERASAGDPQRSADDNYYLPGGTRQASVSASEAAGIYSKGKSMLSSGGGGFSFGGGGGGGGGNGETGQTVAITGNTGVGTGAHLHLQREDGREPTADDIAQFYADGKPLSEWPITSGYGYQAWRGRVHKGIDFGTPEGTKITMAPRASQVVNIERKSNQGAAGNLTAVDFAGGRTPLHLLHLADQSNQLSYKGSGGGGGGGGGGGVQMPTFNIPKPPILKTAQNSAIQIPAPFTKPAKPAPSTPNSNSNTTPISSPDPSSLTPDEVRSKYKLDNTLESDLLKLTEKSTKRTDARKAFDDKLKLDRAESKRQSDLAIAALTKQEQAPLKAVYQDRQKRKEELAAYDDLIKERDRQIEDALDDVTTKNLKVKQALKKLEERNPGQAPKVDELLFDEKYAGDRKEFGISVLDQSGIVKRLRAAREQIKKGRDDILKKLAYDDQSAIETLKDSLEKSTDSLEELSDRSGVASALRKHLIDLRKIGDDYKKAKEGLQPQIEALEARLANKGLPKELRAESEAILKSAKARLAQVDAQAKTATDRLKKDYTEGEQRKIDALVRESTNLDNSADADTAQSKFDKTIADRKLKYDELNRKIEEQILNYRASLQVEGASVDQKRFLVDSLEKLAIAQDNLSNSLKQSNEAATEQLAIDKQREMIALRAPILKTGTDAIKLQAEMLQKYNPLLATELSRRTATLEKAQDLEKRQLEIEQQRLSRMRLLETAAGRTQLESAGITATKAGIDSQYGVERDLLKNQGQQELEEIKAKFPTLAEDLRNKSRDAFADGLKSGLKSLTSGKGFNIKDFLKNITDVFLNKGIDMIVNGSTNLLFGGSKEDKGALGAIEGASIIDQGTQKAADNLINGASTAAQIMAGIGTTPIDGSGQIVQTQFTPGTFKLNPKFGGVGAAEPFLGLGSMLSPIDNFAKAQGNAFDKVDTFEKPDITTTVSGIGAGKIMGEGFATAVQEAELGKTEGGAFAGKAGQGLQGLLGAIGGLFSGKKVSAGSIINTVLQSGMQIAGAFGGASAPKVVGRSIGGRIGAEDFSAWRSMPGPIGDALRREGSNSILAALTPGEYVLTPPEAQQFLAAGGMSAIVPNFNEGGIVGDFGGITSAPATQQQSTIRFEYQNVGGMDVVTREQLEAAEARINRKNNPARAVAQVADSLRGDPSFRRRVGL